MHQKEKTLKEMHDALNKDPLFAGQLKFNMLQDRDKWQRAEKQALEMFKPENMEKFVKLGQN